MRDGDKNKKSEFLKKIVVGLGKTEAKKFTETVNQIRAIATNFIFPPIIIFTLSDLKRTSTATILIVAVSI